MKVQIEELRKENERLKAEAEKAATAAEERFIEYGSHLHASLDEASLRVEADSEIITTFESALAQAAQENTHLQRENQVLLRREQVKARPKGRRNMIIKKWPVMGSSTTDKEVAPCPYARTKDFESKQERIVKPTKVTRKDMFAALK